MVCNHAAPYPMDIDTPPENIYSFIKLKKEIEAEGRRIYTLQIKTLTYVCNKKPTIVYTFQIVSIALIAICWLRFFSVCQSVYLHRAYSFCFPGRQSQKGKLIRAAKEASRYYLNVQ